MAKQSFLKGFELYESRLETNKLCDQTKLITRVQVDIPYWDGLIPCDNLLVVYEQGIGDNILYYRFLIELAEMYPMMKITYFCKCNVSHIFKKIHNNINIIDDSESIDTTDFDYKLYIMSLPYILKKSKISYNIHNYIVTDEKKSEYWRSKLSNNKLKVGFTCKTS